MKIKINGTSQPLEKTLNVTALLQDNGYAGKHVAVAVNGDFVPKSEHGDYIIQDNDEIEIVAPMQGG